MPVAKCICTNPPETKAKEFQERTYGKGLRVFTTDGKELKACTICGKSPSGTKKGK